MDIREHDPEEGKVEAVAVDTAEGNTTEENTTVQGELDAQSASEVTGGEGDKPEAVTMTESDMDQDECEAAATAESEPIPAPLASNLEEINTKLAELTQLFQRKIMHTAHEEQIVDQMHTELQRYKEDMYSQLIRPVLMDLMEVRDSIVRVSRNYAEKPEGQQDIPARTFGGYADELQDILEKYNVTIYASTEGGDFSPARQRAVKKVPTHEEALHGKVAQSLGSGYEYLNRTITPEKVAVYVYEKPAESEPAEPEPIITEPVTTEPEPNTEVNTELKTEV